MLCGTLVSWPGIDPGSPVLGLWSPIHWTTREVPFLTIKAYLNIIFHPHIFWYVSLKCKTFKNKTPVLSTKKTLAVPLYDQIKTGRLFQMQHKIVILLHNIKHINHKFTDWLLTNKFIYVIRIFLSRMAPAPEKDHLLQWPSHQR